jgi:hypothetical protein
MAISITFENSIITLKMGGCHNGLYAHTKHKEVPIEKTNGCGEIKIFSEKFNPYIATPITRLFLHVQFGRKHKIDELIEKFDAHFKDGKNCQENGIEYLKEIILSSLSTDPTWKICPECNIEYNNKTREFEQLNYIIPSKNLCIFHKKDTTI